MTFIALDLPRALLPVVQGKKDAVRCVALGVDSRGLRTPSRATDANLDCVFVENALVLVALKIGGTSPPWPPWSRLGGTKNKTRRRHRLFGNSIHRGKYFTTPGEC